MLMTPREDNGNRILFKKDWDDLKETIAYIIFLDMNIRLLTKTVKIILIETE